MNVRTRRKISDAVEKLLRDNQVTSPPVPVERIARKLAELRFSPLDDELAGMVYVKDGTPIIGVNSLDHPNRQRFTISHECGHFVLHKSQITKEVHVDKNFPMLRRDSVSAAGVDDMEIEANLFAAELLMPRNYLVDALGALGNKHLDIEDDVTVNALARRFRVSPSAMRFRLGGLFT